MTTSIIDKLYQIEVAINQNYIPIVYGIGLISNTLNIILFCRRKLRYNCCSRYFICLSTCQILLLNFNCLRQIIAYWLNYNGFSTVTSLCKIYAYFNALSLVLVRHFICLISVDCWFVSSTNARFRRISSLKNVRWIISCSFLFWIIFSIHAPIGFVPISSSCSPIHRTRYAMFLTIYSIITSAAPLFIAIIFGILILTNIRESSRQVNPLNHRRSIIFIINPIQPRRNRSIHNKRLDMVFARLAVFQIIPYIVFNLISSFSIIMIYSITNENDVQKTAIVIFIYHLGIYILCSYASISFIFYALASHIFRNEFMLVCQRLCSTIEHNLLCR
ncbi:unnamed protein product [Rotaria magnacalcarata]|uniref:G-protein coupled receptors family 1 profile domain-containing protein n=1 Tax=Rotaria magnacalcarata TaxID=392030 RepID=A0A815ZAE5_9BILA|nr:unnamed protein product [Rotaria magnacalcarata]CAF1649473.1 unnamed protein product [Rotaria magnacalcarata]CAF3756954.1 unnamed protein product [Rotaria magnacalcarata]CAF3789427.1 unnamed protein product [Rotaria magnacalcarata]